MRHVAKLVLQNDIKDVQFEKLTSDPDITIIGISDSTSKEGDAIRVVDYVKKSAPSVYVPPIC